MVIGQGMYVCPRYSNINTMYSSQVPERQVLMLAPVVSHHHVYSIPSCYLLPTPTQHNDTNTNMGTQYTSTSYLTCLKTTIPTVSRPATAVRQTRSQVRRTSCAKLPMPLRSTIGSREPALPRQPPRAQSPEWRAIPPSRVREPIELARLPMSTIDTSIKCPSRPPRARSPECHEGPARRREVVEGMLLARISVSAGEAEVPREPPRARSVRLDLEDGV